MSMDEALFLSTSKCSGAPQKAWGFRNSVSGSGRQKMMRTSTPLSAARCRTSSGVPLPSGIWHAAHRNVTVAQTLCLAASIASHTRRKAGSPSMRGRMTLPERTGYDAIGACGMAKSRTFKSLFKRSHNQSICDEECHVHTTHARSMPDKERLCPGTAPPSEDIQHRLSSNTTLRISTTSVQEASRMMRGCK